MKKVISANFDIYKVISELSKTNPVFHNEQGFQDYLVHTIEKFYPKLKIKFEHKIRLDEVHRSYIDILIRNENGLYIPVELKYKTNRLNCNFDDSVYELSNQSAEDITRYGYLKDISRLEKFSELEEKFIVGYAILLTNQCNVWNDSYCGFGNTFENFLINENIVVESGVKKWSDNTSKNIKQAYPSFELKQSYQIKWFDYSDFNQTNGCFKIAITEIKKLKTADSLKTKKVFLVKKSIKKTAQKMEKSCKIDKKESNSQILNEIEDYLSNIPINTIIETPKFRSSLSQINARSEGCYIPTDYCYNRFNNGINFEAQPKFFIYIKRGQVKFVGKDYLYTGPVYHKSKKDKVESEIGYCNSGKYQFYS